MDDQLVKIKLEAMLLDRYLEDDWELNWDTNNASRLKQELGRPWFYRPWHRACEEKEEWKNKVQGMRIHTRGTYHPQVHVICFTTQHSSSTMISRLVNHNPGPQHDIGKEIELLLRELHAFGATHLEVKLYCKLM